MEMESDFQDAKIPTLDTKMWLQEGGNGQPRFQILHEFYEKPMASKYMEWETSARSWTSLRT